MNVDMYIYICVCAYTQTYIDVYMCMYVQYVHAEMNMYLHTYIDT